MLFFCQLNRCVQKLTLLILLLASASFLSAAGFAQASPQPSPQPPLMTDPIPNHQDGVSVPITTVPETGLTLLHIWINDKVDATFVVNTGTNLCLISDSLAKKLELTRSPAAVADGYPFFLDSKRPDSVTLATLRMGGKAGHLNREARRHSVYGCVGSAAACFARPFNRRYDWH